LAGKKAIIDLTAGRDAASYGTVPDSVISAADVIRPIEPVFRYCRMDVPGTVFTTSLSGPDRNSMKNISRKSCTSRQKPDCKNPARLKVCSSEFMTKQNAGS
ncbi:hypothetical protein, partial [Faecalibaculum rodentium]|uniref:hypothetical protein n=1 Tax=Faecalibaculum rodentium TaxID=1702221 RepID=UPI0026F398EF